MKGKAYELFVYFDRFVKRELRLAVKDATEAVAERSREKHSYHTKKGLLEREGTQTRYEEEGYAGIIFLNTDIPYALPVHEGSKPHEIRPKNKQALRWATSNGTDFWFAKRVQHPGYAGDPFIYNAFDEMQVEIRDIFDYRIERAIKEAENAINS